MKALHALEVAFLWFHRKLIVKVYNKLRKYHIDLNSTKWEMIDIVEQAISFRTQVLVLRCHVMSACTYEWWFNFVHVDGVTEAYLERKKKRTKISNYLHCNALEE